ncbi:MAG: ABC transporter ATP-binding protein [Chitinophagales bacterium]
MLIIFLGSIVEVLSFSLIIPVVYIINDPAAIAQSKILNFIYTQFSFTSSIQFIVCLLLGLVVLFLLKNIFLMFSVYTQRKFVFSTATDILKNHLDTFYHAEYTTIKQRNSAEYIRYILEAPPSFADLLMMPVIFILNETLIAIFILLALLIYKPLVVVFLIFTIAPLGILMMYLSKKKLQENSDEKTIREKEAYIAAVEGINGYTDIILFGKEQQFKKSILSVFDKYYKVLAWRSIYVLTPRRIIEVLVIITIFALYGIATFAVHADQKQIILILLAFSTAAYRLLPSLNEILTNTVLVKTSAYVLDLLNFVKSNTEEIKHLPPLAFSHKIELSNINFSYIEHERKILQDANLSINKRDFVVLTGDSGIGKSTIAKLLIGFLKPASGKYLIDGVEVQHSTQIRNWLGYVSQDLFLFDKSLMENIAIGENTSGIDIAKVQQLIKLVNLEELVANLPQGIAQNIGEMGTRLSGGQRQRIAIARALYKNCDLLILDEATSALDKATEQEIIDTLYRIAKEKHLSVLMITHRVTSVKQYDSIYELKNGKMVRR